MQKDELISLVNKMCKELIIIIDEHSEATVHQVANYLQESAALMRTVDEESINSIGYAEALFHNAYQEIAKKSLASYAKTNKSIEKLTKLHEYAINECTHEQIDLPAITEKFTEIQSHMELEVNKANKIITTLTNQVKSLEAKTNLDALTKIFNRRSLSTYLENLCSNKKTPFNFHLLVIDIDDFKKINDTHGHVAGDKVLIFMANLFKKTLRDGDKVFRFGGEEFVIALNRIDDEHCIRTTNRLLTIIRENKLLYKGVTIRTTVSIGSTKFIQGDTPDSLLTRADKALYVAKKSGKDQLYTEVLHGV